MATRIKEKAALRAENKDLRPKAHLYFERISSSKVAVVLDLIRGKSVAQAQAILMTTRKAASPIIDKLLKSAVANAENNMDYTSDELYIAETYANQGPTQKRFRPAARGRATRIRKRSSHITIILDKAQNQGGK